MRIATTAAVLALFATAASAQIPSGRGTDDAGIVFAAYDNNSSYTFYLGETFSTFDVNSPAVFQLPDFAGYFDDINAISWNVVGADALGDQFVGGERLLITGVINNFTNDGIRSGAGNAGTYVEDVNQACGADPVCFATNQDLHYAGRDSYANDFGFTGALNTVGGIDDELAFILAESTGLFGSPVFTTQPFTWTLTADGTLAYGVIPVPAGLWLLLSGMAALFGARRRS